MVDFVRGWRSEFGFEMWDFVVVFGLILACGHRGDGGWVVIMIVIRLLSFSWVDFGLGFAVVVGGWVLVCVMASGSVLIGGG